MHLDVFIIEQEIFMALSCKFSLFIMNKKSISAMQHTRLWPRLLDLLISRVKSIRYLTNSYSRSTDTSRQSNLVWCEEGAGTSPSCHTFARDQPYRAGAFKFNGSYECCSDLLSRKWYMLSLSRIDKNRNFLHLPTQKKSDSNNFIFLWYFRWWNYILLIFFKRKMAYL